MADAADSKSAGRKAVWVRLPPPVPIFIVGATRDSGGGLRMGMGGELRVPGVALAESGLLGRAGSPERNIFTTGREEGIFSSKGRCVRGGKEGVQRRGTEFAEVRGERVESGWESCLLRRRRPS